MGMSAAHCQGNVREFQCLESGHHVLWHCTEGIIRCKNNIVAKCFIVLVNTDHLEHMFNMLEVLCRSFSSSFGSHEIWNEAIFGKLEKFVAEITTATY